jgi:hypothetical protein
MVKKKEEKIFKQAKKVSKKSKKQTNISTHSFTHSLTLSFISFQVYIYSCPDGSGGTKGAPVKLRMLYSSSKAAVAEILSQAGASAEARLEVSSPEDIDEEVIMNALHPPKEEKKVTFSRPMRPGKGGARLVREREVDSGEKQNSRMEEHSNIHFFDLFLSLDNQEGIKTTHCHFWKYLK